MIEVNLSPGATKRPAKRGRRSRTPFARLAKLPKFDRLMIFVVGSWIVAPAVAGWLFFGLRSQTAALGLSLEEARQDSAHYATLMVANKHLRARRDTIARKLEIIQRIDANRYVVSHVMDAISSALPDYTWLTSIITVQADSSRENPSFRIEGRTGNTFALTEFMKDLEASPFLRGVTLTSTELVSEDGKMLHAFALNAQYEDPPPDAIQTVPLFDQEQ